LQSRVARLIPAGGPARARTAGAVQLYHVGAGMSPGGLRARRRHAPILVGRFLLRRECVSHDLSLFPMSCRLWATNGRVFR
jgi:hypothetical protein